MFRSSLVGLALVLAGGLTSWSAPPEPVYPIKLKKPEKGDVAVILFEFEYSSKPKQPAGGPAKIDVKEAPPNPGVPPPPAVLPPAGETKSSGTPKVLRAAQGTGGRAVFLFEETLLDADAKHVPTPCNAATSRPC